MVITKLAGGIGNQLFQYAIARCLAHRRNAEFKLDMTYWDIISNHHHNFYKLCNFNIQENFATLEEIENATTINEPLSASGIFLSEIFNLPPNVALTGYWQNEKYFAEIRDILLDELTLKNPLEKNSAAWRDKIIAANCAVSLHVRHGDYLTYGLRNKFGLLSPEYYFKCVKELRKDYPDITLFVFSDDLDWCKESLKFDVPTEFVEGCEHDYEEIHLMSLCKHNIISNGTFAWWGAWLNKNPDQKVFAPDPWFTTELNNSIVPESWIKIPVEYNSDMSPMLSIILYVQNDKKILPIILTGILSQTFTDYELIIVNVSTGESGKICRQFAQNDNVTIISLKPSTNKFIAWNKGLSVARGDYVLFFSDKNFVIPYTATILQNVCDNFVNQNSGKNKTYITYATFDNYTPNVICTTQYLAEDDGGNIVAEELPNKRFSIQTDEAFKDLPDILELNLDAEQKLMLMATKGVNNFVSTKIFKRKFLYENKITFKEKAGGVWTQSYSLQLKHFWRRKKLPSCRRFSAVYLNKFERIF